MSICIPGHGLCTCIEKTSKKWSTGNLVFVCIIGKSYCARIQPLETSRMVPRQLMEFTGWQLTRKEDKDILVGNRKKWAADTRNFQHNKLLELQAHHLSSGESVSAVQLSKERRHLYSTENFETGSAVIMQEMDVYATVSKIISTTS